MATAIAPEVVLTCVLPPQPSETLAANVEGLKKPLPQWRYNVRARQEHSEENDSLLLQFCCRKLLCVPNVGAVPKRRRKKKPPRALRILEVPRYSRSQKTSSTQLLFQLREKNRVRAV